MGYIIQVAGSSKIVKGGNRGKQQADTLAAYRPVEGFTEVT